MTAADGAGNRVAARAADAIEPQFSVGGRVRALRRASGMTQTDLAHGRFSKEYVSQVERGKTRPSGETLEWLARRLGTDRAFLELGVSAADASRAEKALARAERLVDEHKYADAVDEFREARAGITGLGVPALALRALRGQAWAEIRQGEVDVARTLLAEARVVVETPDFTDVDRADLVFLVGVCAYTVSEIDAAVATFEQALELAESSRLPCDRLRSDIFHWRARCYRRLRDWPAAREDIDRALELADARSDPRQAADALFQASLVAQREGQWLLARRHADESKTLFAQLGDRATVARLLNNIAGLNHLLGDPETAVTELREAFEIFVDLDLPADAGYVLSSLADIHLDTGNPELAETQARKALALLADRVDHLPEIGTARLALGRSLLAQSRIREAEAEFDAADATFVQAASVSHQADAWIARGDLARRSGDEHTAARLYRQAAENLLATGT